MLQPQIIIMYDHVNPVEKILKRHGEDGNWYNDSMAMKKLRIYLDTSVINFLARGLVYDP